MRLLAVLIGILRLLRLVPYIIDIEPGMSVPGGIADVIRRSLNGKV